MQEKPKIPFSVIEELENLKKQAREIYDLIDIKSEQLFAEYGQTESVYEIDGDECGYKYVRIKVIDNVTRLQQGEALFKAASFKPVDVEVKRLKRLPK